MSLQAPLLLLGWQKDPVLLPKLSVPEALSCTLCSYKFFFQTGEETPSPIALVCGYIHSAFP
jgi:hypothetical protein